MLQSNGRITAAKRSLLIIGIFKIKGKDIKMITDEIKKQKVVKMEMYCS